MLTGQFIKGKIDGIQKYFKTATLRELLPKTKLDELEAYSEVGEYPRFFKTEKVLSKTIVTDAENSDGRRGGVVNRTVLYKFDQNVTKDTVNYLFPLDDFIAEILGGKRRFKMPPMPELPDTDMGLIELPPPIEWEVSSN
jgi:hypothetical protein